MLEPRNPSVTSRLCCTLSLYHFNNILYFFSVFPAASPKIIKLREEPSDYPEPPRGKSPAINSTLVPVKGISNLGNTCFFNAVMQVGITIRSNVFLTVKSRAFMGERSCILQFNHFYYATEAMHHLVRINKEQKEAWLQVSVCRNLKHDYVILKWIFHWRLPANQLLLYLKRPYDSLMSRRDFNLNMVVIWICLPLTMHKHSKQVVLFLHLGYSNQNISPTMPLIVNRLGLELIQKHIQCSSKCRAGLGSFTCLCMSGTQLVQSMFAIQHSQRVSPVFLWSCHGDCKLTCLFDNEAVFFRHFVNHPQGLPRWLKFEWARFTCFSLLLPVCLYCLLENCNLSGENT